MRTSTSNAFFTFFSSHHTKAGQTHSLKFSTLNRHSTRKLLRSSWPAWESSGPSQRRGQMSCVGSTGNSSAWWVTGCLLALIIKEHCTDIQGSQTLSFGWSFTSMKWTVICCLGFSVKNLASSVKMIHHPSDCLNLCASTHRWAPHYSYMEIYIFLVLSSYWLNRFMCIYFFLAFLCL